MFENKCSNAFFFSHRDTVLIILSNIFRPLLPNRSICLSYLALLSISRCSCFSRIRKQLRDRFSSPFLQLLHASLINVTLTRTAVFVSKVQFSSVTIQLSYRLEYLTRAMYIPPSRTIEAVCISVNNNFVTLQLCSTVKRTTSPLFSLWY